MAEKNGDSGKTLENVKEEILRVQNILQMKTGSSMDLAAIHLQKIYDMVDCIQDEIRRKV